MRTASQFPIVSLVAIDIIRFKRRMRVSTNERKEIKMNELMIHCGAAHVERSALGQVVLPAATETHQPIAHDYFADLIEDRLNEAGMRVVDSHFALQRGGSDMFGLMTNKSHTLNFA